MESASKLAPTKPEMEAVLETWSQDHSSKNVKDQDFLNGLTLAKQVLHNAPDLNSAISELKRLEEPPQQTTGFLPTNALLTGKQQASQPPQDTLPSKRPTKQSTKP